MHELESFSPRSDFRLDLSPLLPFDFAHHVALDDDFLIKLVNFSIDNLLVDGFDCPGLYIFSVDLYN